MIIGKRDKALFESYKNQRNDLKNNIYEYVYNLEVILRSKKKNKVKTALLLIEELPCWISKVNIN